MMMTKNSEEMVDRVEWFSKSDYPIMSFFENHEIEVSPKVLAANIGYDRSYMGRRLRALRESGLLVQHDNELYALSDIGREFLAGELSQSEIEALDPKSK